MLFSPAISWLQLPVCDWRVFSVSEFLHWVHMTYFWQIIAHRETRRQMRSCAFIWPTVTSVTARNSLQHSRLCSLPLVVLPPVGSDGRPDGRPADLTGGSPGRSPGGSPGGPSDGPPGVPSGGSSWLVDGLPDRSPGRPPGGLSGGPSGLWSALWTATESSA